MKSTKVGNNNDNDLGNICQMVPTVVNNHRMEQSQSKPEIDEAAL